MKSQGNRTTALPSREAEESRHDSGFESKLESHISIDNYIYIWASLQLKNIDIYSRFKMIKYKIAGIGIACISFFRISSLAITNTL